MNKVYRKWHIIEKNINQITSYFVEEGPGRDSEDMKDCDVNCFDFFSVFMLEVVGGKNTVNLKEPY